MKLGAHCVLYGPEIASDPDAVISRLVWAGAEGCELGERFFSVDDRPKLTGVLDRHSFALAGMHANHLNLMELLREPEKSRTALENVAKFVAPLPDKNVIATGMPGAMDGVQGRTLGEGAAAPELHDPEAVKTIARNLNAIVKDIQAQYGVQITALRAGEKTSACIPDITASRETAKRLLHLLADGTVTPETACDVVEDFLEGGDF